ncbi:unnamed protein product [Diamesa tonsa]
MAKTMLSLLSLLALFVVAFATPIDYQVDEVAIEPVQAAVNYRLNEDVMPTHYKLELTPYFEAEPNKTQFTFDGVVTISLAAVTTPVSSIVLHANKLTITKWTLTPLADAVITGTFNPTDYDSVTHKWTIPAALKKDQASTLTIEYSGILDDDMNGFYRSSYKENNVTKWLGTTQFQQTEARRAFPCMDEPGFKATFQLIMNRPKTMKPTISNTKIMTSTDHSSIMVDTFKITPKMSTYLLAFIVSDYEGMESTDGKFGVFARPESKPHTEYALNFGIESLKALGDYLGVDYYSVNNVEKMDMAAIPDFSAGAMENWGLLTYREALVLFDPKTTSTLSQQRVAAVIAHEQAHQWFGDLLTCKWWEYTWLNEGFARYFQYFGTEMVASASNWDLEYQFVVENLQQSMILDSSENTHPMTHNVNTPSEVSGIFDNISYNKGGSILRMLKHMIGADKFQATLKHYLGNTQNQFTAVTPDNLWTSLEFINPGTDISKLIAPWTTTSGFPLVTATLTNNKTVKLTQKRFLSKSQDHTDKSLYNVPVTVAIDSKADYTKTTPIAIFTIAEGAAGKTLELPKAVSKYFIMNVQQTGYYRVNYDAENWGNISEALHMADHDGIHVMNRAQIVDDLFNLARIGIVQYKDVVDITSYLKTEKNYIPWLSAITGLAGISPRITDEHKEVFSWYVLDLMKNIYDHLTFDQKTNEPRTDIYNRNNVLAWACKYGHEACISKAKEHFELYKTKGTMVHPDLRSVVYCNGIRHGGDEEFKFLWDKIPTTNVAAELLNIHAGLSCTTSAAKMTVYLDYVLATVRKQDQSSAISSAITSNPENVDIAYEYITKNFVAWTKAMGGLGSLSTVAGRFTKQEQVTKLEAFINTNKATLTPATVESLTKAIATAKTNMEWDKTYLTQLTTHLKTLKNSAPIKSISIFITIITLTIYYLITSTTCYSIVLFVTSLSDITMIKLLIVTFALLTVVKTSPIDSLPEIQPAQIVAVNYRLNDDVIPSHYKLEFTPYFEKEGLKEQFTFDGVVIISLKTIKPNISSIVLHANELNIDKWEINETGALNKDSGVFDNSTYEVKTHKWTIPLKDFMKINTEYQLRVEYTGALNDEMKGFYRSSYKEGTLTKWLATTQFQSTDARRAFPCMDEPGFKATFQLTMNRPSNFQQTISNTQLVSSVPNPNMTLDSFETTPKMSTYLLAFIVSNYESTENVDKTFGVFARPEAKPHTDFALQFGQEHLQHMGKVLGFNFTDVPEMKAMKMAAIPDFSAGAMENWGLLTYRETLVLYYKDITSSYSQQQGATVIAHEQAHQWFGDLLTCKWWSDTWLNEGFARYFEYFGTETVSHSDVFMWELDTQFNVEQLQRSMILDASENTHPLSNDVNTPSEISAMFDNISYNKGASILRMLYNIIGKDKFYATLKHYVANNKYNTVTPDDLWTSLDMMNPGAGLIRLIAPWTTTAGFPLVTAIMSDNKLKVTQRRFLTNNNHKDPSLYNVPITVQLDGGFTTTLPIAFLRIEDGIKGKEIELRETPSKYFLLNYQQTGYYRVNYDAENWANISKALRNVQENHDGIDLTNRAQIVDDLFNLARSGIVHYDTALDIINYLKVEKDYLPWLSAINGLTFLDQRISKDNRELFSWYILDLMDAVYKYLQFDDQEYTIKRTDIYNRANVLAWICKNGHEDCLEKSKVHFTNFVKDGKMVHPDYRSVVYCNGIRHGTIDDFQFMWNRYLTVNVAAEQLNILNAFGCTLDPLLMDIHLRRTLNSDVRKQDKMSTLTNALNANPENVDVIYNYITSNMKTWKEMMGGLGFLSTVVGRFTTEKQIAQFESFINDNAVDLIKDVESLRKSVATAKANLVWDQEYIPIIVDHLSKMKNSSAIKSISVLITFGAFILLQILH